MPLVSVVMAAKNYARFLPAAVESVFAQTEPDWELVVIDDGSTDATPTAIRPYLADRRVRYVRSDRLGQSRAKNLGVGLSRGEYVAFLDADDVWKPTKLAQQLAEFRSWHVGVVFTLRELIDEAGNPIPKELPPPPVFTGGNALPHLFVNNFVCFSSAVVRREVFDRVGGFDPTLDLGIDYDLWLRAAPHFYFWYVPESLVLYRTGHGNLSQKIADRVATAFAVMHRCVHRRKAPVWPDKVAEGYGSTCRNMGWLYRRSDPRAAVGWYLSALRWPGGRVEAAKGLLVSAANWARGLREHTAAENRLENR